LGFRLVRMQGSHAGSISSQRTYGDGRSTWMPTTYDPNENAAVLRGWPAPQTGLKPTAGLARTSRHHRHTAASRLLGQGPDIDSCASLHARVRWSEVVRGGGSENLRCVASDPSIHTTNPRASSDARPSRPFPLPIAFAAVPRGLGLAPRPYVPATGPRRTQDRPASLDGCDGTELRPRDPGGSYLLGLGAGHRLDSQHSRPSGAAGSDRAGVVRPGATLPLC
jgi:hypothetical protein